MPSRSAFDCTNCVKFGFTKLELCNSVSHQLPDIFSCFTHIFFEMGRTVRKHKFADKSHRGAKKSEVCEHLITQNALCVNQERKRLRVVPEHLAMSAPLVCAIFLSASKGLFPQGTSSLRQVSCPKGVLHTCMDKTQRTACDCDWPTLFRA